MQVKQYFLIGFTCFFSSVSFACMCLPAIQRLDRDMVKEYSYIARLKVKSLMPHPAGAVNKYVFTFEEIEHLQGPTINQLAVQSYHPDFQDGPEKTSSSCDFLVQPGVEYLFFARQQEGELITGFCDIIQMERDGVEHRGFGSAYALLQGTRRFFNIIPKTPIQNGSHELYYPNGEVKHKANYKNGQQHGKSIWKLATGEKYVVDRYKQGVRHGKQQRLSTNDNYCINYRNGQRVGKAIYFGQSKKKKYKAEEYSSTGKLLRMVQFDEKGKVRREVLYDPISGEKSERYFQDGQLMEENEE